MSEDTPAPSGFTVSGEVRRRNVITGLILLGFLTTLILFSIVFPRTTEQRQPDINSGRGADQIIWPTGAGHGKLPPNRR